MNNRKFYYNCLTISAKEMHKRGWYYLGVDDGKLPKQLSKKQREKIWKTKFI